MSKVLFKVSREAYPSASEEGICSELSMMVMSSAEPDETTGGIIFTVLAVSLQPVFSLSDTSIQMNPRQLWGVEDESPRRGPRGRSTDRRCFSSNCRRGGLAGYPVKTAGSF